MSTPSVISVVDDDASVRSSIRNFLRSHGYVVHTFGSAGEFLESPYFNDTSCVIADLQMPAMNGLELQAKMRVWSCAVPLIFITSFPDESIRARALEAGAICFLGKPFPGRSLLACLDAALAPPNGRVGI